MKHWVELVFNVQKSQRVIIHINKRKRKVKVKVFIPGTTSKNKNMSTTYTCILIVIQTRRNAYINHTFQRPSLR